MPDNTVENRIKNAPMPNTHNDQAPSVSVNMLDNTRMVSRPAGVSPIWWRTPAPRK